MRSLMSSHFTKIICTIGPASCSEKVILQMISKGMRVARLNFSHGSHEEKRNSIKNIRTASESMGIPVAILADLCGPKLRMGQLQNPVVVKKGTIIDLGITESSGKELFTDVKKFGNYVNSGDRILVDDGLIEFKAVKVEKKFIRLKVMNSGVISAKKGINLPDIVSKLDVFTKKDRDDLDFAVDEGVDLIAMSFVDSPSNFLGIKKFLKEKRSGLPVIAKIERPQALKNLEKIVDAFDGIMIARGDLGVEVPLEDVPFIQKKLIRMASEKKKIVITATQMLESMVRSPMPTRAEVTDVTNAILEGSDLVMLSGETAVGDYPVKTVETMGRIASRAEKSPLYKYAAQISGDTSGFGEAIAKGAAEIAAGLEANSVMVFSYSGNTAKILSKFRPPCPIFAFSPDPKVVRLMSSFWGVTPIQIDFSSHTDEMIQLGERKLIENNLVKKCETIVVVAGETPMKGATNMVKLLRVI